jgi:ribonuclease D
MEAEGSFLGSLVNLTMASHHLAPDIQRDFLLQDPLFRARSDFLTEKTLACLMLLLRFLLPSPQAHERLDPRRAASVSCAVSEVANSLLADADLLFSAAAPSAPVESVNRNGVVFIFSRKVPRPPPFRRPRADPAPVKPISAFPRFDFSIPEAVSADDVLVIASPDLLEAVCLRLLELPFVFVAVEIHDVHTYRPFPCLVTIMTPAFRIYIVDLLAIPDVSPLVELFASDKVTKVFGEVRTSLPVLWESLGIVVNQLLDAVVVCQLMDLGKSYEDVLSSLGLAVVPSVVDWRIRPLVAKIKQIAVRNVCFLPHLLRRIAGGNIDMMMLIGLMAGVDRRFLPYQFESHRVVRLIADEHHIVEKSALGILAALVDWRDTVARDENESPGFIALDQTLARIAELKPETVADLEKAGGVISPHLRSYACEVVARVRKTIHEAAAGEGESTRRIGG